MPLVSEQNEAMASFNIFEPDTANNMVIMDVPTGRTATSKVACASKGDDGETSPTGETVNVRALCRAGSSIALTVPRRGQADA